jgi:hypothetical protein
MLRIHRHIRRGNAILRLIPLLWIAAVAALTSPGCRHKDNPYIPPIDTTASTYHLFLRADSVMYIGNSGHVDNDTITVRVYDEHGALASGLTVRSRALLDPSNPVTNAVVTSADTVHHPWGTGVTPLVYWGVGADNGEGIRQETIFSYITQPTDTVPDTLAKANITFTIRPAP